MNSFLASLLLIALIFTSGSHAFVPRAATSVSSIHTVASPVTTSPVTTALHLRVKVDPNEKPDKLNPATFKNAAYLGSIAIAVLLPVFFLIASSK